MRGRWLRRVRAVRWPAGMGIAAWRWVLRSRRTPRRRISTEALSEVGQVPRHEGDRVQDVRQGVGPVYQRRYLVRITGSPLTAAGLMERLGADLNAASPVEVAVFDKISGAPGSLETGDEYLVHMPGPWNCPVRVVEKTATSFRFATLQGHLEAGEIEFRAADAGNGDILFTIESWARSGDRLAAVLYASVGIAKEMQLHMWTHFCGRVAELAGGRAAGKVMVETERADVPGQGGAPVTRAVTAAFARTFALAARLRGGRPLHPRGLVVDAVLDLHGTSRYWGVPLLDSAAELRGTARLSRAAGLPAPLPDVLGLALRWLQPETAEEAAGGPGGGAAAEDGAIAELLLATTGTSLLGRRLLYPMTRWSPAFYGSLLPYRAGDQRVLLGAAARTGPVPARPADLAHALERGPLLFDLVVATEFGGWERFGELRLTGPVRSDETAPMRFDPARHPIRDLPPSGLLQQVRGRTYRDVQAADRRTADARPARDRPPVKSVR
ncbi:MAG TPA: DUF1990 family protein [Vulgatibacteraceae bacterium]|nr:DUF1990 family protein [Vulgatibacteraceae bacterium]